MSEELEAHPSTWTNQVEYLQLQDGTKIYSDSKEFQVMIAGLGEDI